MSVHVDESAWLAGESFPVKPPKDEADFSRWAYEVWKIWADAGFPPLVGGISAEQLAVVLATHQEWKKSSR